MRFTSARVHGGIDAGRRVGAGSRQRLLDELDAQPVARDQPSARELALGVAQQTMPLGVGFGEDVLAIPLGDALDAGANLGGVLIGGFDLGPRLGGIGAHAREPLLGIDDLGVARLLVGDDGGDQIPAEQQDQHHQERDGAENLRPQRDRLEERVRHLDDRSRADRAVEHRLRDRLHDLRFVRARRGDLALDLALRLLDDRGRPL